MQVCISHQQSTAATDVLANKCLSESFSKPSVWRDSALGLAASLGVGVLTGTALTLLVFSIVAITIGQ